MSCSISKYDFCLRKGDTTPEWYLKIQQLIEPEQGATDIEGNPIEQTEPEVSEPIDLSNYEFAMEIRLNGEIKERLTEGNGLTVQGDKLIINKRVKEPLDPANYTWALKMRMADGDIITFIEGRYLVKPEIVNDGSEL